MVLALSFPKKNDNAILELNFDPTTTKDCAVGSNWGIKHIGCTTSGCIDGENVGIDIDGNEGWVLVLLGAGCDGNRDDSCNGN